MKYWLESLSENGFDVFTVVYMAVLFIVYHYLMRWFFNIKINKIEQRIDVANDILWRLEHAIEEINSNLLNNTKEK